MPVAAPQAEGSLWWNSAALLGGTVVSRFSRAGAFLLAARLLGPDRFGPVAAGLASYEMLRVTAEAGLDTRLIRRVAQHPEAAGADLRDTVAVKAKLAALLLALGALLAGVTVGRSGFTIFVALSVGVFGLAVSGSTVALATARLNARDLLPQQAASGVAFFLVVAGLTLMLPPSRSAWET